MIDFDAITDEAKRRNGVPVLWAGVVYVTLDELERCGIEPPANAKPQEQVVRMSVGQLIRSAGRND